jgi:hypothetical protein
LAIVAGTVAVVSLGLRGRDRPEPFAQSI